MAQYAYHLLRKARDARGIPRWKLGQEIGESDSTIERWETGETRPTPDDVDRFAEAVGDPSLWHEWMMLANESYKKRFLKVDNLELPVALMRCRYEIQDVMRLQDQVERDAIDGKIDDKVLAADYAKDIDKAIASLRNVREQLTKQ